MNDSVQTLNLSRSRVSRRTMMSTVAAAATVSIVPRFVLGGVGQTAPSDRVTMGVIGVGGQGTADMQEFLKDPNVQVVAVCDVRNVCDYSQFYYGGVKGRDPARQLVNETYANQRQVAQYDGCEAYWDFHDLLDRSDIDAVSIGTPDHMHAIPALAAIKQKKHVYCQKPLTHSVYEARALAEAAREHNVVTQMGNQLHGTEKLKRLVEMLQAGAIGRVREIHVWTGAAYGGLERPKETLPIPQGFDWDRWLGPAPGRPYHLVYAPFTWRNWRDFGTGALGDFGCHIMDPAMWAVGLPSAMTIEAHSSAFNEDSYALANIVKYQFIPPSYSSPISLTWYDGGFQPFRPSELEPGRNLPGSGGMYVGTEGIIIAEHGGDSYLIPEPKMAAYSRPAPFLPRNGTHYQEWVLACRRKAVALSNFDYAGSLTEMVLLGNVAIQSKKILEWDHDKFEVVNDPGANALLHREYREGWTL